MYEDQKKKVINVLPSKKSENPKFVFRAHIVEVESIITDQLILAEKRHYRLNRQAEKIVREFVYRRPSAKKAPKLEIAPGFKLHNFLTSICPKSFSERELDALHADSVELYCERLRAGDIWGAKRVAISMRFWLLWTVLGGVVTGVFSMIRGKQKSSE